MSSPRSFVTRARWFFVALGFLPLLAIVPMCQATLVRPTSFEEMADKADLIVTAWVVGSRCEWGPGTSSNAIFTRVTLEVLETHKGAAAAPLELRFLGGRIGDTRLEVDGIPEFRTGEKVVLFLRSQPGASCPVVSFYHGKLSLQSQTPDGTEVLIRRNGKPVTDLSEIGSDNASHGAKQAPVSLEYFKTALKAHLKQSSRSSRQ
jgi:hypothetical protein